MSTIPPKKRLRDDEASVSDGITTPLSKRRRSQSNSSDGGGNRVDGHLRPPSRRPPSAYELDQMNYHIHLQEFGAGLQKAANAIFPGEQKSRYKKVDVILLSWEDEDPKLPVSVEIKELAETFNLYGYTVRQWLIPAEDCHIRLQTRILQFLGDSDPGHLKIVYYAGHGRLTNHGQPAWTSLRNSGKERCPTVKWSGIQNTLEESRSDVLILLDCCASGVCTTDEGNGVTELIAACAYNAIANGVGPFSFTHALNAKLRMMARLPHFTVGYLFNAIFTEVQGWRSEDSRYKKAPVHLVLSQNLDHPRSIRLSKLPEENGSPAPTVSQHQVSSTLNASSNILQIHGATKSTSGESDNVSNASPLSRNLSPSSSATSVAPLPLYPRLLFSIRVTEDVKPNDLCPDLFSDWLRQIPISASLVRVEAGFASDSTLIMCSIPAAMVGYLPAHPAIVLLGSIRSQNIFKGLKEAPKTVDKATDSFVITLAAPNAGRTSNSSLPRPLQQYQPHPDKKTTLTKTTHPSAPLTLPTDLPSKSKIADFGRQPLTKYGFKFEPPSKFTNDSDSGFDQPQTDHYESPISSHDLSNLELTLKQHLAQTPKVEESPSPQYRIRHADRAPFVTPATYRNRLLTPLDSCSPRSSRHSEQPNYRESSTAPSIDPGVHPDSDKQRLRNQQKASLEVALKLKREMDKILRLKIGGTISEDQRKHGFSVGLECIAVYMHYFEGASRGHRADAWESAIPLWEFIDTGVKNIPALHALSTQLGAIFRERLNLIYVENLRYTQDSKFFQSFISNRMLRDRLWSESYRVRMALIELGAQDVLGPWTTAEEAIAHTLNVLALYREKEDIQAR
ncbi:hypothetical protein BKA64DRAFT_687860 [Cadophora sp. MPI-SDFR-AT-0126]|nr:hypothetical protein BKA64DRAFT_687860 [Leotiomycetes sp. MPI-SDFR-AT-0126]